MSSLKRGLLLIGSPRGIKSNSTSVGNYLLQKLKEKGIIEEEETIVLTRTIRSDEKLDEMITAIKKADLVILASPLYDDTVSCVTLKALEYIAEHQKKMESENVFSNKLLFPIANSGFPEPEQMKMLIVLFKKFAKITGFKWAGSVSIGLGQGLGGDKGRTLEEGGGVVQPIIEILEKIADSINNGEYLDRTIGLIPEIFLKWWIRPIAKLFVWMNNKSWKKIAESNGGDVKAKPYAL